MFRVRIYLEDFLPGGCYADSTASEQAAKREELPGEEVPDEAGERWHDSDERWNPDVGCGLL